MMGRRPRLSMSPGLPALSVWVAFRSPELTGRKPRLGASKLACKGRCPHPTTRRLSVDNAVMTVTRLRHIMATAEPPMKVWLTCVECLRTPLVTARRPLHR